MQHLTPSVLRDITGGESAGELPAGEVTAIVTDSRAVKPGCLFAAIAGARADGHDYIASAAEQGALCALGERFVKADIPQTKVPDTQAALRAIAAFYRSLFSIPFVGVTGSVGKTTAKEMIWAVLSTRLRTLKTEKNFNNELGVPLTLFRLRKEHEAAVVEMGISAFGEMTRLADMVHPGIAVFTTIGDAHLEFLKDRAGVLRAKTELLAAMPEDGIVIANGDDPLLREFSFGRRTLLFGMGEGCHIRATEVRAGETGMEFTLLAGDRKIPVHVPAFGQYMVYAALMGAAVGLELGLTDGEIAAGIAAYETVGSRGRLLRGNGITVLDDCYNANPTSCRAALESLAALAGRPVAILGGMLELGEKAPALHRALGEYAAELGVSVIACGELSRNTAEGAGCMGCWFPDMEALLAALPELIMPGDSVLVKASHAMNFEAVVKALTSC